MKTTYGNPITAEMKAHADAVEKCGNYSIANPKCALKDNPFFKECDVTARKAFGSIRVMMWCPICDNLTPPVSDDLRTACCGSRVVNINDHRLPSRRR